MTKTFFMIDKETDFEVAATHEGNEIVKLTVDNFYDILKEVYQKGIEKGKATSLTFQPFLMYSEERN